MKAVLRGKFIALSAHIKKVEKSHTSNLTAHLKALEQNEENRPKKIGWQELINLRTKINQIESKKMIQRMNKRESWFFEEI